MLSLRQLLNKQTFAVETKQDLGDFVGFGATNAKNKCAVITQRGGYLCGGVSLKRGVMRLLGQVTSAPCFLLNDAVAVNTQGNLLGTIADVCVGKTLKLSSVTLSNDTVVTPKDIYALGQALIVKCPTTVKKHAKPAPLPRNQDAPLQTKPWIFPTRKYGDFSFLLGKRVDKNITNFQGEIMLKNGQAVTQKTLAQAKIAGKLIELCLHVK